MGLCCRGCVCYREEAAAFHSVCSCLGAGEATFQFPHNILLGYCRAARTAWISEVTPSANHAGGKGTSRHCVRGIGKEQTEGEQLVCNNLTVFQTLVIPLCP